MDVSMAIDFEAHLENGLIHPTALVHEEADVHSSVVIGPFSIIGPNVTIAKGTVINANVIIDGWTTIGENNQVCSGAIIGNLPQDLKFSGEKSYVQIGNNNIIREYANINRGTEGGGLVTKIGDNNLLMTNSHVAHDSVISNNCILGHSTLLGGHVEIGAHATISALCAIHQFCKIGTGSMIGGGSMIVKDVMPYTIVKGHSPKLGGLNVERLKRLGFSVTEKKQLKRMYQLFFQSSLLVKDAITQIEQEFPNNKHSQTIIDFIKQSTRGIYR